MNPYKLKRNKTQEKIINEMIHHIDIKVGERTTGFLLALLCGVLDEISKDHDQEIRSIEIVINDFFSKKFDFEKEKLENEK